MQFPPSVGRPTDRRRRIFEIAICDLNCSPPALKSSSSAVICLNATQL
jgi:hypothetical protein